MFDLVIRKGTVVDGTGAPAFLGDVGIINGSIVTVESKLVGGKQELDATGLVVAPGFIDPHTHYDAQLCWDPLASCSSWHGVTTVVIGNCGFGVAPCKPNHRETLMKMLVRVEGMTFESLSAGMDWDFESIPQYLSMLGRKGLGVNVAALVPHSTLRLYAMGDAAFERNASEDELGTMTGLLSEAMKAGALGLSSSNHVSHVGHTGAPVPSRMADDHELESLARAVAQHGVGIVQLARETSVPPETINHAAALARKTGVPITFGSIRHDPGAPRKHVEALQRVAECVREGVRLFPQVSSGPLTIEFSLADSTVLCRLPSWKKVLAAPKDEWPAILRDEVFLNTLALELSASGRSYLFDCGGVPLRVHSVGNSIFSRLVGEDLTFVTKELGTATLFDAFLELSIRDHFVTMFEGALMNTDDSALQTILKDPNTLLSLSDAGAHATLLCEAGQTSRLLGYWTRKRKTFSLEEAIRRITSVPADVFGLLDRGRIRPGLSADIVVFDPATIDALPPEKVHDMPGGGMRWVQRAHGIVWSLVNGHIVIRDGCFPDPSAASKIGRVLAPMANHPI